MKPLPLLALTLAASWPLFTRAEPLTPTATPAPRASWQLSPEDERRLQEDYADQLRQLGIQRLRPGRNPNPGSTTPPNYDEAFANPFPHWPPLLVADDGTPITTPEAWWAKRRPEIVEVFEREVFGRIPANVPALSWSVTETRSLEVAGVPVVAQRLIGTVDNRGAPSIEVHPRLALVLPANPAKSVPVLIMFGFGNLPDEPVPRWPGQIDPPVPPSHEQLIKAGWGYVSLDPSSVQADNGAGLTRGIIGLTNRGGRRTPDQWGTLRAWAWGASRVFDYLETLPHVDRRRIGIEGVSRYGKAALATLAFDPRFAVGLIASSGEGGTKPHRRNFGEAVENLTWSGSYHWMAGNFLKYGAEESTFGRRDANDLPVDAHHLIALCAPRAVFVSYGIPEKGDALWLDQQGSYMATVAAGEAWRLLGERDLGDRRPYSEAKMPPPETDLLEGKLAWRQHMGGHESRSNMAHFIRWAEQVLK